MHRGVNLNTPFEQQVQQNGRPEARFPADGAERSSQNAAILQRVANAGFDTIRLNVEPLILVQADGQQLDALLTEVRRFAENANRLELRVIVDMHVQWRDWQRLTPEQAVSTPLFERFLSVLGRLAHTFENADPAWIALELFNEPQFSCSPDKAPAWNELSVRLFKEIRKKAPKPYVIVSGACWGGISGLVQLNPSDYDARTLFTFHFYDPTVFSYQGETWGEDFERYVPNLPYPPAMGDEANALSALATELRNHTSLKAESRDQRLADGESALRAYFERPQSKDFISSQFSSVARWADLHGVQPNRIFIGEFGAMRGHGQDTVSRNAFRDRYLEDVVQSAEQLGFGVVIWEYCCVMGITQGDFDAPLDPNLLKSIGLK